MKKIFFFLFLLIIPIQIFAIPEVKSEKIYFYSLDKEQVLYEKGSSEEISIASLTKIMTAVVALEKIENLDASVTLTSKDFKGLREQNASVAGFRIGEEVTYRDLLYGLLLPSGADAALALSNHLFGSEEAFVKEMNNKVEEFHLEHTHFVNTTGLDIENHYSSVEDVAIILKEALKNEEFKKIFTTKRYVTSNKKHTLKSTLLKTSEKNKLDTSYILGSKTGYTYAAGLCLASITEHDGELYLLVTANADYKDKKPYHIMDTNTLYQYFFNQYEYKTILKDGQIIISIPDENEEIHNFYSNKEIIKYLPKNSKIDYQYDGLDIIPYEMKKGDKIGEYKTLIDEEVVDVQEFYLEEEIIKPFSFPWKIFWIVLIIIIIFLFSIILCIIRRKKRYKKGEI